MYIYWMLDDSGLGNFNFLLFLLLLVYFYYLYLLNNLKCLNGWFFDN